MSEVSRAERFATYAAEIAEINQDAHEAVVEIVEYQGTRRVTEREFRRVTERQAALSTAALRRAAL